MTFTKLTFAALALGASLTPALAESGASDDRLAAFLASQNAAAPKSAIVEGRQAAPIAAPAQASAVDRYLNNRTADQNR